MLQLLEFLGRLGLCLLSELGSATACYRTNLLARPLLSALSPGTRTCLNLLMFFIAMMMEDCFLSPFTSLCYFWPSRVDIRCLFQLCTHNAQILEPGFYSRRDGVCTCRKEGSRFFCLFGADEVSTPIRKRKLHKVYSRQKSWGDHSHSRA